MPTSIVPPLLNDSIARASSSTPSARRQRLGVRSNQALGRLIMEAPPPMTLFGTGKSCPGAPSGDPVDNDQGVSTSGSPRSAANWRIAPLGYLRCLPSVRVKGSFPSRAHRVTVFGDT
jgi:hypothetical protein